MKYTYKIYPFSWRYGISIFRDATEILTMAKSEYVSVFISEQDAHKAAQNYICKFISGEFTGNLYLIHADGSYESHDEFSRFHSFDDKPSLVKYGDRKWHHHGKSHRENGPAIIQYADKLTSEEWYHHGILHRLDGPAFIRFAGDEYWWINGTMIHDVPTWIQENDFPPWKDWGTLEKTLFALRFR